METMATEGVESSEAREVRQWELVGRTHRHKMREGRLSELGCLLL